ncbi:hypothetical protein DVH24_025160 [Malus domestica]|uniref:Uncharacterized protein n=1 Tax=Malus domestica TaxID=3750 RepID=A0A498HL70_MALDO|nr:hypothetical protein DVH24_025160 [Malus domestica]
MTTRTQRFKTVPFLLRPKWWLISLLRLRLPVRIWKKKNPGSPAENGRSSYDLPHSQAVPASLEAQRESIRPESNAVLKSRPVNDELESRNVKTSKEEPQSSKKEPTGIRLDDKREEITLTKPDVKLKRGGLNQSSIYLSNNSTFKEDGENQNPNLSTPPMNQAKAMKATIKSSTEKKQPIESTTPNNEVLPKLRSTLSARNIMLGPNYDEEINKTLVSVERLSSMKKCVFGLSSAQENVVKLSKQLSHLKVW